MHLYFEQVAELINIIDKNQLAIVTGKNFVTPEDKLLFLEFGINYKQLHVGGNSPFNDFNFGMLADSLKAAKEGNFAYNELREYVRKGKYIPQSKKERLFIEYLSTLQFDEIKAYPEFEIIRNEIIRGAQEGKILQTILSNIGHKTGIWGLHSIISHYHNTAFELARATEIKDLSHNKDPLVYKHVPKRGCYQECARLYLTNGIGSQPRIFKLSELEHNGSNKQKPAALWKPTVVPTHIGCSCMLFPYSQGYLWDIEKQSFSTIDPEYKKMIAAKRPLIKVSINGKEHWM